MIWKLLNINSLVQKLVCWWYSSEHLMQYSIVCSISVFSGTVVGKCDISLEDIVYRQYSLENTAYDQNGLEIRNVDRIVQTIWYCLEKYWLVVQSGGKIIEVVQSVWKYGMVQSCEQYNPDNKVCKQYRPENKVCKQYSAEKKSTQVVQCQK